MALDIHTRKNLKALGHKLNPVVMVAGKGLSDAVLEEVRRALHDHELIKVKVAEGPMEVDEAATLLVSGTSSELVQVIGRMVVLFKRRAKDPIVLLPGEKAPKVAKAKTWLSTPKAKKTASRPWAKAPRKRPAPSAGPKPAGPKPGGAKGGRGR